MFAIYLGDGSFCGCSHRKVRPQNALTENFDRLFVLDNGRIIESGSHKELIKKSGKYAELWDMQSKKEVKELLVP